MKKLVLILIFLNTIAFTQADDDNEPLLLGLWASIDGNLLESGLNNLVDVNNLGLKVLSGKFTLTQTGLAVQAILDGTMDFSIDITGTSTNQIKLPSSNDPATPTIAFGDGNSGFYEAADNDISIALEGNPRWSFTEAKFTTLGVVGASIERESPTAINPVINPRADDDDTGIGWNAEDQLSLIAGGVEALRITEATDIVFSFDSLNNQIEKSFVADDGEIVLATGVAGWGFVMIGDMQEYAHFTFTSAGVVTLGSDASANTVNTDTDAKFCIYDAGSGIAIKNRLGSNLIMAIDIHYYTP